MDIKDSNKKVQTEISKYLDSKVHNVRSSAKLIDGKTKTYKTEVEATVKVIIEHGNLIKSMNNFSTSEKLTLFLLYVADGKLVTSTDFKLSMSDLIFFIF
jgi:hypothetical protein